MLPVNAANSKPMSWLFSYCLDFGVCFNYPKEYWFGYFDALRQHGYNGACLYVSGTMPMPGYEPTLQWRCDYVGEMVDYLHKIGMRAYLHLGLFGWMGMSPGLIRMHPEIEITWPEKLKEAYSLESMRRGICPTRGKQVCLDYVMALFEACPQADGLCLEIFCEKPHCECADCQAKGLWRVELDFLKSLSARLWKMSPKAEIIWALGYERTHGKPPESNLYDEIAKLDDPRYIWWLTRPKQGYLDASGARREWMDPAVLARLGRRVLTFIPPPGEEKDAKTIFRTARAASALGAIVHEPNVRYMFLPELAPSHFGFTVQVPPPERPQYEHVLFHLRALRRQMEFKDPDLAEEKFAAAAAKEFFADCGNRKHEFARYLLFWEKLIIEERLCMARSQDRLWNDLDGNESLKINAKIGEHRALVAEIAALPPGNRWLEDLRRGAAALMAGIQ